MRPGAGRRNTGRKPKTGMKDGLEDKPQKKSEGEDIFFSNF